MEAGEAGSGAEATALLLDLVGLPYLGFRV